MADVTIRELRNHGGEVIERVESGERLTVTRAGRAVAELRPIQAPGLGAAALLRRWRSTPPVDAQALRRDIDNALDSRL
jgi:prevent-host-death family protein